MFVNEARIQRDVFSLFTFDQFETAQLVLTYFSALITFDTTPVLTNMDG